jgi:hypothetical protein
LDVSINAAKDTFVGLKVVEVLGPEAIIERQADKVKPELR